MAILNRVRVVWTGVAGSPAISNLYFIATSTGVNAAHAAVTTWATSVSSVQASGVTYTVEGDVAQVDTATDSIVGVTTVAQTGGTVAGSFVMLPSATQMLVRHLTSAYAGGRQVRGRTYVPYIRTGAANGPVPAGPSITLLNSATSTLLTSTGPGWCVYSPRNATAYSITGFSVWTQFGVMRSRRD